MRSTHSGVFAASEQQQALSREGSSEAIQEKPRVLMGNL